MSIAGGPKCVEGLAGPTRCDVATWADVGGLPLLSGSIAKDPGLTVQSFGPPEHSKLDNVIYVVEGPGKHYCGH